MTLEEKMRAKIDGGLYEGRHPSVKGSDTSKKAAESVRDRAPSQKLRVKAFLRTRKTEGATEDQIEQMVGLIGSTARPRIRELQKEDIVVALAETRLTSNKELAHVYVLREYIGGREIVPYEEYRLVKRSVFDRAFDDLDEEYRQSRWEKL
jgi:hypothetical protein